MASIIKKKKITLKIGLLLEQGSLSAFRDLGFHEGTASAVFIPPAMPSHSCLPWSCSDANNICHLSKISFQRLHLSW